MYLRESTGRMGLAQGGAWWTGCLFNLSNPDVRTFTFPFASPGISGPRGYVWFIAQLVAASAELRTTGSCSHLASGRPLGEQGGRTPPISPSSGQLPEKRMIVTS